MQFSATNRTLAIPEIVALIFSHLGPIITFGTSDMPQAWFETRRGVAGKTLELFKIEHARVDRVALLSAARSCTAFSSSALDVLWRAQISILPLLSILPVFKKEGKTTAVLTGKIQPSDWRRFRSYSNRVRYYSEKYQTHLTYSISMILIHHLNGEKLMPRLVALAHPLSPSIYLFVSHHLQCIQLNDGKIARQLSTFMSTLPELAPALRSFGTLYSTITAEGIYPELKKFRDLQSVEIVKGSNFGGLPADGIRTILSIESLRSLRLCVDSGTDLNNLNLRSGGPKSLQSLMLAAPPSKATVILRSLTQAPLEQILIGYEDHPRQTQGSWDACLEALLQWNNSLQRLSLRGTPPTATLKSLSKLRNLKYLNLHLSKVSDDDVRQSLVTDWPYLSHLEVAGPQPSYDLFYNNQWTDTTSTSFKAIEMIAAGFPDLHHLTIQIRDISSKLPTTPQVLKHDLTSLRIICHPLRSGSQDPDIIAKQLDALFPNLKTIVMGGTTTSSSSSKQANNSWEAVGKALRALQASRMGRLDGR